MTLWTPHQLSALVPPDRLDVTRWSEVNVEIPERISPVFPGRYSSDLTPYLREIQNVCADEEHHFIVIQKAVQVGASQMTRNAILFWLTHTPAPILLIYPDQESSEENLHRKVLPAIHACKATKGFISDRRWDTKKGLIALSVADLGCGWSGSAESLSSDPFCFVICDEVDKFQPFAGANTDAVSLGVRRTTTFRRRRKVILLSTPTLPDTGISAWFASCSDQRDYHLPCPSCGALFLPSYSQLRYERVHDENEKEADRLEAEKPVRMACPLCDTRIEETSKPEMVRRGEWISRGFSPGKHPRSERIAYQIHGLLSLVGPSWSEIVATHLRAKGSYTRLMDFFNHDLGEPFVGRVEGIKSALFEEKKARGYAAGIVPSWAGLVLASADSQQDHFWYMVRAWGRGGFSRLLSFGRAESFGDLYTRTLRAQWPVEGTRSLMSARCLLIDSGGTRDESEDSSLTEKVYRFAKTDPARIWPTKGRVRMTRPVETSSIAYKIPGSKAHLDVLLRLVDTTYFKDVLAFNLEQGLKVPGEELWQENAEIDERYVRQMTSEHKVSRRRGKKVLLDWQTLSTGTPNHLWDAAVLQCAGAYMMEAVTLPSPERIRRERESREPKEPGKLRWGRRSFNWRSR